MTFQISVEKTILPAKFKPFQNYSHMIKLFTRYLKPREAAAKRSYQFRESGMRKRKKKVIKMYDKKNSFMLLLCYSFLKIIDHF